MSSMNFTKYISAMFERTLEDWKKTLEGTFVFGSYGRHL